MQPVGTNYRTGARARQIVISLKAQQTLPHCLRRNSFQLIFHNLLDNAIRYEREGGMVVVELSRDGDSMLLSVTDAGPWMPFSGADSGRGVAVMVIRAAQGTCDQFTTSS